MTAPSDLSFPHTWEAEILYQRPPILPARRFVYPRDAEEVERGALEAIIRPLPKPHAEGGQPSSQEFLATCAVGFRDPMVPTGVWSSPRAEEICCVSGGYAYLIDTANPERFTFLPVRPVLALRPIPALGLMIFVGHNNILAWGAEGEAWQSAKLSDEGITIVAIDGGTMHGLGWNLFTDKETPFVIDLRNGARI
jgi:hypothetical protein